MKNVSTLCIGLLLLGSSAQAQTLTPDYTPAPTPPAHSFKSHRGHEVLPQAGDWGLGISATSFLNYIGNLFNNSTVNGAPVFGDPNAPNAAFAVGNLGGVAVMGKYMHSSNMAYRIRFQANAGSVTNRNFVLKNVPTPDPLNPQFVEDKLTTSSVVVLLAPGFEKRRGDGRLQGFYGAEAILGATGQHKTYTYGNGFSKEVTAPTSTIDFSSGTGSNLLVRPVESNRGTSFLLGARGFAGVEYFFAAKMSLGGEVGYTLGFSTNGKGFTTTEQWYSGTSVVASATTKNYTSAGVQSFGIGLDNVNAGINLHFYF